MFNFSWFQSISKCLKHSCSNIILAHWVSVKTQNHKYCSEDRRQGKASRVKIILKLKIAHIDFGTERCLFYIILFLTQVYLVSFVNSIEFATFIKNLIIIKVNFSLFLYHEGDGERGYPLLIGRGCSHSHISI